jgi:hypothetical protein
MPKLVCVRRVSPMDGELSRMVISGSARPFLATADHDPQLPLVGSRAVNEPVSRSVTELEHVSPAEEPISTSVRPAGTCGGVAAPVFQSGTERISRAHRDHVH